MFKKTKIGKISAVIFITVLIWVWADLALDATFESEVTIIVDRATTNELLVNFDKNQTSVNIEKIIFKGPASKISLVQRQFNDGSFDTTFFFNPKQQEMTQPNTYPLDVLNFLRQNEKIKNLGITVESCQPQKINVNVMDLVKKQLVIQCSNEDGTIIKTSAIVPEKIDMFVPAQWSGDALVATVQLTRTEIENSKRLGSINKTPFIEILGQRREAQDIVKISIAPDQDNLTDFNITNPTLGITLSTNLQGKYEVKVLNESEVMRSINISATARARSAYESARYHVILEIYDNDVKVADPRTELIYNFPPEFVGLGEIKLKDKPVMARFTLKPIVLTETPEPQPQP